MDLTSRSALDLREQPFVREGDRVVLIGGKHVATGDYVFPLPASGECEYHPVKLHSVGDLWAYTVQRIPPKSPPYLGIDCPERFTPFGVGYVLLADQLLVEARLCGDPAALRIGMRMRCTTLDIIGPDGACALTTYAFEPHGIVS